jgi:hypothetical protein
VNGKEGVAINRAGQLAPKASIVGAKANLVGAKSQHVSAQQLVAHEQQNSQGHLSPLPPPFTPLVLKTDGMAWERKLFRPSDKSVRTHLRGTWTITPSFLMAYK